MLTDGDHGGLKNKREGEIAATVSICLLNDQNRFVFTVLWVKLPAWPPTCTE